MTKYIRAMGGRRNKYTFSVDPSGNLYPYTFQLSNNDGEWRLMAHSYDVVPVRWTYEKMNDEALEVFIAAKKPYLDLFKHEQWAKARRAVAMAEINLARIEGKDALWAKARIELLEAEITMHRVENCEPC